MSEVYRGALRTCPDVTTKMPLAGSLLSAMMEPAEKYRVWLFISSCHKHKGYHVQTMDYKNVEKVHSPAKGFRCQMERILFRMEIRNNYSLDS